MSKGEIFSTTITDQVIQVRSYNFNNTLSSNGRINLVLTKPQITNGTEIWSGTFTPLSASSTIHAQAVVSIGCPSFGYSNITIALFNGSDDALQSSLVNLRTSSMRQIVLTWNGEAGTADPITYSLRCGNAASPSWHLNRTNSTLIFSTSLYSNITFWEVSA